MPSSLAYVVWQFPKLSETFVVEELRALEQLGVDPLIFARDRPHGEPVTEPARALLSRSVWLSQRGLLSQVGAAGATISRHPLRSAHLLGVFARARSRRALLNLWFGLILATEVRRRRLRYLHAHFADTAAELAFAAARIEGIDFGVTAHAADIYLGRFLCRKLDAAALRVTVCEYNVAQIRERCGEVGPILVKYAGVDADEFRLSAPRPPRPGRRVVAVGRLTWKKGFDVLLRSIALLRDEGREVVCVIAGDGEADAWLRQIRSDLGLDDVVQMPGAVTPDEVKTLLAEADVLAAPCTLTAYGDRDSMPVIVKEAMAMELPVVATDAFGIPEMVTPDSGVLVAPDDPVALAGALCAVLDLSPERRAAMGRAGRAVVEERFREIDGATALRAAFAGLGVLEEPHDGAPRGASRDRAVG
ncbi:MAG: glycosyltransferase [Microthrixaceae bacterium]